MDNTNGHSTSTHDESDDLLNFEEKDTFTSDIELPNGKKLRLNPPSGLLDVGDEGLCCILLNMFGCKKMKVLRPRLLQKISSSYGFIHANNRILQVFRDIICKQVCVLDANFPSVIDEDAGFFLSTHTHPRNICFLAKMIGDSLQTVSLPCYLNGTYATVEYQQHWTLSGQSMMLSIANFCTKLKTLTFQDSGIMVQSIAERFLASNPGLKRVVVHSPTPAFLSALTKSDCVLECLVLLHVGPESFEPLLAFLLAKGGSINYLSIETSAPFKDASEASTEVRMRYRRMVRMFMLCFEKVASAKLESLSTVALQPYKHAQWYKDFILRFQRMGRAKLLTGPRSGCLIYNPALNGVDPPVMYKILHLDYLLQVETEQQFRNYLERAELPDCLLIISNNFFVKFADSHVNEVSSFVKAAIREKGHHMTRIRLACAVYSSEFFTKFLNGMSEILDTFEESFGSLKQLQRLHIPIDLITYLVEDRGYDRFLVRLSNLRQIFLSRPLPNMCLNIETPKAIPKFLKCLTKACRNLDCVSIAKGHYTRMRSNISVGDVVQARQAAWDALDEFEEENQEVDVHTLRKQVLRWSESFEYQMTV